MGKGIEHYDALTRDICRLFAEGERAHILRVFTLAANPYESAMLAAMAVSKMSPGSQRDFANFLFTLCSLMETK